MRRFVLAVALCAVVPLGARASTAPTAPTFRDPATNTSCGIKGKPKTTKPASLAAFDPELNQLKNRIEMPSRTKRTTVAEFRDLPDHDKQVRRDWSQEDLDTFGSLESQAVRIEGYLIGVKQSGAETTNCGATDPDGVDFHLWLVDAEDADKDRTFSAVVEVTPRWRKANPAWSCQALFDLIDGGALFRVSGWRLYDYEHAAELPATKGEKATRSTLWEIHPVTKIEVATDAGWLEVGSPKLDQANLVKTRDGDTFSTRCKGRSVTDSDDTSQ